MKVTTGIINRGTDAERYVLLCIDRGEKFVMPYAPNNWKTERGAKSWAKKRGYEVS